MGRHLVDLLQQSGITPVCVNRGNSYWGESRSPATKADRVRDRHNYCESVRRLISDPNHKWLGVVDFCAYEPRDITDSLPCELFEVMPVYIFISTDSVYEVFDGIERLLSVSESVTSLMEPIPSRDDYGWNKYQCEITLLKQNCRSVFLRLPDVLGEFDDTYRLWGLQLWLKSGLDMKVENPDQIVSFCYAKDVTKIILDIFTRFPTASGAYNIACDLDQWTMGQFIETVSGRRLSPQRGHRMRLLPSVEYRRSPLDCSRARNELGFKPTPLRDVLRKTDEWFEMAENSYREEYIECIRDLPKRVSQFYKDDLDISSD